MEKNQWPTIIATMIVVAVVIGGGIYYWQVQNSTEIADAIPYSGSVEPSDPASEVAQVDSANVYEWKTQGITFSYLNGYNVLKRNDSSLLITTAIKIPDGDISTFGTLLEIDSSTSLKERVAKYSMEETFRQETIIIGGNEFTKVLLYSNFGGYNYTRYLLEFNGKLLDYKVGKNDEGLATEVLESIQF